MNLGGAVTVGLELFCPIVRPNTRGSSLQFSFKGGMSREGEAHLSQSERLRNCQIEKSV